MYLYIYNISVPSFGHTHFADQVFIASVSKGADSGTVYIGSLLLADTVIPGKQINILENKNVKVKFHSKFSL